jgi:hypothetical protein
MSFDNPVAAGHLTFKPDLILEGVLANVGQMDALR